MHPTYAPTPSKNQLRVHHRDTPVTCAACGRQVSRKTRHQRFCSTRCRKQGFYAENVRQGVFNPHSGPSGPLGTRALKNVRKFKRLRGAKPASNPGIQGPRAVLQAEVIDGHDWVPVVSSDGVKSAQTFLRPPALVGARHV